MHPGLLEIVPCYPRPVAHKNDAVRNDIFYLALIRYSTAPVQHLKLILPAVFEIPRDTNMVAENSLLMYVT